MGLFTLTIVCVCVLTRVFFSSYIVFLFLSNHSARICSTVLNRNGENRHPCLVSDFRRKKFHLLSLSMMLAVGFSCKDFMLRKYLFVYGVVLLVMKRFEFCLISFPHQLVDHVFSSYLFVNVVCYIYCFFNIDLWTVKQ